MKIAIVGAGHIGGTIGEQWSKAGHEVTFGLRDPSKRPGARPIAEALPSAEVVLLALPGAAVVDFVREHARSLDGKIVIDATNNIRAPSANAFPALTSAIPKAHLYRAFNSLGFDVFQNPIVGGTQADLFYCGPEGSTQSIVERLIADASLRPIRVGGTDQAGTVDGVLRLWFTLSLTRGRRIAFKLLAD